MHVPMLAARINEVDNERTNEDENNDQFSQNIDRSTGTVSEKARENRWLRLHFFQTSASS